MRLATDGRNGSSVFHRLAFAARPLAAFALAALALMSCAAPPRVALAPSSADSLRSLTGEQRAFLDTLEARAFRYFWDTSDSKMGLTRDRSPSPSFISVGAMGFALSAYPVGVERGYVSRADAAERVRRTLQFLWRAPQDSVAAGVAGWKGFFYHFLHASNGTRFEQVELSSQDTALLIAGVLFCESYFDRGDPAEVEVRAIAESLYRRVDWAWLQNHPPTLALGWLPESGYLPYDWGGYNETMILHVLALGSPTHPVRGAVWPAFTKGYRWGTFHGQEHLGFAPLFGHQYSHCWIDFRGIQDGPMREHALDYFENSRRATLAQRAYAVANPQGFAGYDEWCWGLTACDGPVDATHTIDGRERTFRTYAARGASFTEVIDDGTISPSAAGGSIAFAPEIVIPTLMKMRERYGEPLFGAYGFVDAFNPTLKTAVPVQHGRIDPRLGWFDTDYLGIDQGPILLMTENARTGLLWRTLQKNPHVVRGLRAAGFRGGWLERAPRDP